MRTSLRQFSLDAWFAGLLACSALILSACGGDDGREAPAVEVDFSLASFNYGLLCDEYQNVDSADVGTDRLPGTRPGACEPHDDYEECAVCRGAAAIGLSDIGVSGIDHYYYGSPVESCADQFATSLLADKCEAIWRGTFQPMTEGLSGPSGIEPLEIQAGAPNSKLGDFAFSIPRFELTEDSVELARCSNFYGPQFEAGLGRVPEACPSAERCVTCITKAENDDQWSSEAISYRRASQPDGCRKLLAENDPDGCAKANRGLLVINRD